MKNSIWLLITTLALAAGAGLAEELAKFSLDDASAVGPKIQADAGTKVEGKASVRIETRAPTSVCLGEVSGLDVENARLVYTAKVKTELEGDAYLEMLVELAGVTYFSKGLDDPVKGKTDWKPVRTPFLLQQGQKPGRITLNLVINGKGTVWVDDVVLSKEPLK